jgi:hypothetical protein
MSFDQNIFTDDQTWLQQVIKFEQEAGIDIQIGGKPPSVKHIDPAQLQLQLVKVRLFSVLFAELRHVLTQANLGAGLKTALDTGRLLIQQRLISLSSDQVRSLEPLLANITNENSDQSQTTLALFQLVSDSDWQTITDAAIQALQANLTQHLAHRRSA